uniref:Ovule protein n=1 Tax=Panagrolaimus sp. PS1159 TaxID=55785 RepID=A0AC35GIW7_9BILA
MNHNYSENFFESSKKKNFITEGLKSIFEKINGHHSSSSSSSSRCCCNNSCIPAELSSTINNALDATFDKFQARKAQVKSYKSSGLF